jgi:hypothetical protein
MLDAALEELRQVQVQRVQPADLLPGLRKGGGQTAVSRALTRRHEAIADALLGAAGQDRLYQSAAQVLPETEPLQAGIARDALAAALRRDFSGKPLRFRSAKAGAGGTDVLAQQLAQAMSRPLVAQAKATVADWPEAVPAK